jgi:hypothetical protein
MKKILLTTTAFLAMSAAGVHAQSLSDQVITALQQQGYERIEVTNGATQLKVEAVRDGRVLEAIYNLADGAIIRQEVRPFGSESDDNSIPLGVSFDSESDDFDDEDDGENDDENDDDENDDESDDDESDDESDDDERDDDERDDDRSSDRNDDSDDEDDDENDDDDRGGDRDGDDEDDD